MESYEVLKDVLKTTSAKQIASEMGLSLSLIYRWTETPPASATPNNAATTAANNPLDRVEQLLRATQTPTTPNGDTRIAQWVCEKAGGFFIKNSGAATQPTNLIPATNAIIQEFADMLHEIASASADQQVNASEAKGIRNRWEELKSVTEGFVRATEQGTFDRHAK